MMLGAQKWVKSRGQKKKTKEWKGPINGQIAKKKWCKGPKKVFCMPGQGGVNRSWPDLLATVFIIVIIIVIVITIIIIIVIIIIITKITKIIIIISNSSRISKDPGENVSTVLSWFSYKPSLPASSSSVSEVLYQNCSTNYLLIKWQII